MTGTTTSAPPTTPGERPAPGRADRLAVWSLVCGVAGLLLVPAAVAAVVLGILALRRLSRRGGQGRGLAIAGVCTGAAGILVALFYAMMAVWMIAAAQSISSFETLARLQRIHGESRAYADLHGVYPDHVARLVIDDDIQSSVHEVAAGDPDDPVEVTAGSYDLADFDGSAAAARALDGALDALDASEPFYRFGRFWFVRLASRTDDPDIVFAWGVDPSFPCVLTDDGKVRLLAARAWPNLWQHDAAARRKRGLPAVPTPPNPFEK